MNLKITRGAGLKVPFSITGYDLTGKDVFFTLKKLDDTADNDNAAVAKAKIASGYLELSQADTLIPCDRYKYDFKVYQDGVVHRNTKTYFCDVVYPVTMRNAPPDASPDLKDLDGNVYTTFTIGNQEWIVENLRVTKYADGSAIPNVQEAGFDDWFLGSYEEMREAFSNLNNPPYMLGNFTADAYWTSSEGVIPNINAESFHKYSPYPPESVFYNYELPKSNVYAVRPIRTFTSEAGAYALRDIGPAGGWIFYIDGTTYYEAAPADLPAVAWSNITDTAIGTTGTAIGTGAANTAAIIAQAGHTASAAKLCNDYTAGGWANLTTGAYCAYDNDTDNIPIYGLLYNWFVTSNIAYLERNGVQETGWRVPTDADFTTLSTELGGDSVAGGKLKEEGTEHWNTPNTGATNESGFTGLGSGARTSLGSYSNLKLVGAYWSATGTGSQAYRMRIQYDDDNTERALYDKKIGYPIRLVRDVIT